MDKINLKRDTSLGKVEDGADSTSEATGWSERTRTTRGSARGEESQGRPGSAAKKPLQTGRPSNTIDSFRLGSDHLLLLRSHLEPNQPKSRPHTWYTRLSSLSVSSRPVFQPEAQLSRRP